MRKIYLIFVFGILLTACQSTPEPKVTSAPQASVNTIETQEPFIASYPGVTECGQIDKAQIEAVYNGRWKQRNGEPAQQHTLVLMKQTQNEAKIYYASGVWKKWDRKVPSCFNANTQRDGNYILLDEVPNRKNATLQYFLNGETARGKFKIPRGAWLIDMTRVWAAAE